MNKSTTTIVSRPAALPLSGKITLIKSAWSSLAPDATYGGMTLATYTTAVQPFVDTYAAVALGRVTRAGAVVEKILADKASQSVLNRVVAAIKADAQFGPDSAFYRACGYLPNSERTVSRKAKPVEGTALPAAEANATSPSGKKPSVQLMARLGMVLAAWEELYPEYKLAGLTSAEFRIATAASADTRDNLLHLRALQSSAISTRNAAEIAALRVIQKVVASVVITDGKASPIYHAMGYVNVG